MKHVWDITFAITLLAFVAVTSLQFLGIGVATEKDAAVWSEFVLDDGAFGEGEGYTVPADGVRVLQEVIISDMALPKQSCYLLQDGERITRLRNRGAYSTSFTPGLVLPPGSRYVVRCPHGNKLLINYPTFILSGTLHQ